uniref:Uncharacterized protein n=1 Tax=Denticeps clupeoides TaxID=299321 RepID=A0AAY4B6B7_9TELE
CIFFVLFCTFVLRWAIAEVDSQEYLILIMLVLNNTTKEFSLLLTKVERLFKRIKTFLSNTLKMFQQKTIELLNDMKATIMDKIGYKGLMGIGATAVTGLACYYAYKKMSQLGAGSDTAEVPGAKQPGDGNKDQDEDEKLKALLCEVDLFLNIQHSDTFKKIDANYVLKKHLDRFFALGGKDPVCSYLLGRWCYNMATRRELTDTANSYVSYQGSSSIHEALDNFLEADKLSGGSSMRIKLYIAKCYDETGLHFEASALARKALDMRNDSDEDAEVLIHELEALIR